MSEDTNSVLPIIALLISGLSFCVSGISLAMNIWKTKLDKSKLVAEIKYFSMNTATSFNPSNENDDSKYRITVQIENRGYKEERITNVKIYYGKKLETIDFDKSVSQKAKIEIQIDIARKDLLALWKIRIIPMEDRSLVLGKREINKNREWIYRHIEELKKEWKDGKKISNK